MMSSKIILIILLGITSCSCISNKSKVRHEKMGNAKSLIEKFSIADSLYLFHDSLNLASYTRKELMPYFKHFTSYRKATVLNYLACGRNEEDILLIKKIIKSNPESINRCGLVSLELIDYYNMYKDCKSNDYSMPELDWDSIFITDQKYRALLNNHDFKSSERDSISLLMFNQDSFNRKQITSYINKVGIRKILKSDCECKGIRSIFFVAQHSDDSAFRKFIIKEFSKQGLKEKTSKYLAYLIDRQLLLENKKQIFGTQTRFNKSLSLFEPYPIENPDIVDELRFNNNLPPLKLYIEIVNKSVKE